MNAALQQQHPLLRNRFLGRKADDHGLPLKLSSRRNPEVCIPLVVAHATSRPSRSSKSSSGHDQKQEGNALGLRGTHSREEAMKLNFMELVAGGHGVLFGSRIPKHYFMIKGFGETDSGDGVDPWETGSYDLALEAAGIMDFNITQYTSVIPPESTKVSFEEAKPIFRHGAVMEAIMASMNGVKGDRITAGVARIQIRRKKDKVVIGGYAAEYKGHARESEAIKILTSDLHGIFERRFNKDEYEIIERDFMVQESEVEQGFGTVIAAICFVTYVEPVFVSL